MPPKSDPGLRLLSIDHAAQRLTAGIYPQVQAPRYTLAVRASSDGFWEWDVESGVVYYSPRWQEIAGRAPVELTATLDHWLSLVHDEDRAALEAELSASAAGTTISFCREHRIQHPDGMWRWVVARGISDRVRGCVAGSVTDQTEYKTSDPLTSLPNRLLFLDRLEHRLQTAHATGDWGFSVISLDLERYKCVNESLGYAAGDALLLEAVQRLDYVVQSAATGSHLLIARIASSEFSVLHDARGSSSTALDIARSIQDALSYTFFWGKRRVSFSARIGLAGADPAYLHPEDMVRDADLAMYQAKVEGSSRPILFTTGMRERALRLLHMETELRNAIESGEMTLHYQPEVDLATNRIIGFEALARWMHPERGLIPPAEFIPVAEETGLILPLGDWGLKQACNQLLAWRALGGGLLDLKVSVNLSAKQFAQTDLVTRISDILAASGIAPEKLSLEMTESSLVGDADAALSTMERLHALGIGLHMDDFGTGYSSLNHLHRFPFDTLKIDRSFVSTMTHARESHEIVGTIVNLARSLKMNVVAEGIENMEQMQWLRSLGCRFGQGYYFARPMTSEAVNSLIAANSLAEHSSALHVAPVSQ